MTDFCRGCKPTIFQDYVSILAEICVYLNRRDSFANTDAIQTDEEVEMREIEFEKENCVQTVSSQTDREMSLENTEKDDHFSAEDDSLCAEDENLSTEDDNLSVSDKLKNVSFINRFVQSEKKIKPQFAFA